MEARVKTLERENKALHEGYAALLKAMGKVSSAFAQCVETMQDLGVAPAGGEDGEGGAVGKGGKKKRQKRAPNPDGQKRALTAYQHFMHAEREKMKATGEKMGPMQIMTEIGSRWKQLPESDKAGWKAKAAAAKADAAANGAAPASLPRPTPPRRPARPRCTRGGGHEKKKKKKKKRDKSLDGERPPKKHKSVEDAD